MPVTLNPDTGEFVPVAVVVTHTNLGWRLMPLNVALAEHRSATLEKSYRALVLADNRRVVELYEMMMQLVFGASDEHRVPPQGDDEIAEWRAFMDGLKSQPKVQRNERLADKTP